MTAWSYSDLKKRYGEDGALARLPYMKGLGQYEPTWGEQPTESDGLPVGRAVGPGVAVVGRPSRGAPARMNRA